ncbi:YheC/YheD family endospore coat-associated protein [Bacillus fonticola]|uniref:YheC/YheD family endospore coat-associated protein n=1 Tax=Bacillus fonticola TaxID=2728853 RepID=UPI0014751DBE|nr:YheC/YheD family protein [Bacillus fonticola]
MNTLGFLTLSEEIHPFVWRCAQEASAYELDILHIVPTKFDPKSGTFSAKRYNRDQDFFEDVECGVPTYLYDRCTYGDDALSRRAKPIVQWLKSRKDVTFLGYGLPDKWKQYEALKRHSNLSPYLPKTTRVEEAGELIPLLQQHGTLCLKPIHGAHGFGIYKIEQRNESLYVATQKKAKLVEHTFPSLKEGILWLNKLVTKFDYMVQPFLSLQDDKKQPFDIRVFLQKNEEGKWIERGRGVRVGKANHLLSNLAAGAKTIPFDQFLKTVPTAKRSYLLSEIDSILYTLPTYLEETFHPLFELGIDIAVSAKGAVWVLDVNSKPGRKVLLETNAQLADTLAKAPLAYTAYLLQASQGGTITP